MNYHNPEIDWKAEKLEFSRCLCHYRPEGKIKLITKKQIKAILRKGKEAIYAVRYWKTRHGQQIPEQYKEYEDVFGKPEEMGQPEHKPCVTVSRYQRYASILSCTR